jgi:hypothetical protein
VTGKRGLQHRSPWHVSGPLGRARLLITALAAAGILAITIVGPPLLLETLGDPPWTLALEAGRAWAHGQLVPVAVNVLMLGAWLVWGAAVVQVVSAVKEVRRGSAPILADGSGPHLTGWAARLIARRLVASFLIAPLSPPISMTAYAFDESAAASASGDLAAVQTVNAEIVTGDANALQGARGGELPLSALEVRVRAWGRTATFWGLAEEFLGEGRRWREVWALNEGRKQADGSVMQSPRLLVPGWTVLVPRSVASATAARDLTEHSADEPMGRRQRLRYSIEEADRLGDIAVRFLGDYDAYPRIQVLNENQIADADHIEAGDTITLPAGARDRGRADHALGRVQGADGDASPHDESTKPKDGKVARPLPRPPDRNATQPAPAKPLPPSSQVPLEEESDTAEPSPEWLVPATTAVVAGLMSIEMGRRRRRKRGSVQVTLSTDADQGADTRPAVNSRAESASEDTDVRVPASAQRDQEPWDDARPSDKAVDQARRFIHESAERLHRRMEETEQTEVARNQAADGPPRSSAVGNDDAAAVARSRAGFDLRRAKKLRSRCGNR